MSALSESFLPEGIRAELLVYAREALPEEACGFLIGTQAGPDRYEITATRPARNLHPHGEDRFTIDPLEYKKAERYCIKRPGRGLQVLGFWHSHPASSPEPSSIDLEEAQGLFHSFPTRFLYLIVSLRNPDAVELACWRLDSAGRRFEPVALG